MLGSPPRGHEMHKQEEGQEEQQQRRSEQEEEEASRQTTTRSNVSYTGLVVNNLDRLNPRMRQRLANVTTFECGFAAVIKSVALLAVSYVRIGRSFWREIEI